MERRNTFIRTAVLATGTLYLCFAYLIWSAWTIGPDIAFSMTIVCLTAMTGTSTWLLIQVAQLNK